MDTVDQVVVQENEVRPFTEGVVLLRGFVHAFETQDVALLVATEQAMKDKLEAGLKTKADLPTMVEINLGYFVAGFKDELQKGRVMLSVGTGSHGERVYVTYDKDKGEGKLLVPMDNDRLKNGDSHLNTLYTNFAGLFGQETYSGGPLKDGLTIEFSNKRGELVTDSRLAYKS